MRPELEAIREARQISQQGLPELALHQINFGMTLCHSARCLGGGQRRKALAHARKAYEKAETFIVLLLKLDIPEYEQVTAQHQRLKFEIESLGG